MASTALEMVPNAVMTTKTAPGDALRAFSMNAIPSSPGILRSVRMTSGVNSSSLPRALKPSAAVSVA